MRVNKVLTTIKPTLLGDYILAEYGPMSHLKLQKLLFYCEAYHLASFSGNSLVEENFEAWVHGPVCRSVYNEVKGHSVLYSEVEYVGKDNPRKKIENILTTSQIELVDSVLEVLKDWKDTELEEATHNEQPWINARKGYGPGDICSVHISKQDMEKYYREELNQA